MKRAFLFPCFFLVPLLVVVALTIAANQRVFPFEKPEVERDNDFSFLVYGDVQDDHEGQHRRLLEAMRHESAVAIFNTGDISDDNGRHYEASFLRDIEGSFPAVPFFPSPGNHDVAWGSHESRGGFRSFFEPVFDFLAGLPGNQHLQQAPEKTWYRLRLGSALFLVLDSNFFIDEGKYRRTHSLDTYTGFREQQLKWVRKVLDEAAQDPDVRWKFVFFHHSPLISHETVRIFNLGGHPGHRRMMMRQTLPELAPEGPETLLDLFRLRGVTAVFSGHEHYYERWQEEILEGEELRHRIHYVVIGTGGAKQRKAALYKSRKIESLLDTPLFEEYRLQFAAATGLTSRLQHVFPNEEQPDSRFYSYTKMTIGPEQARLVTRDADGQIRDQAVF